MINKHKLVNVGFCSLYVHKDDPGISRALRSFNPNKNKWPREPEFMEICVQEIDPNDVILDIGANIGFMTAFFSTLVHSRQIYAVEPAPKNIEILKKNVELLGIASRVEITQAAFSDQNGLAYLELSKASNLHSLYTQSSGNRITVECFNLTDFLKNRVAPNFIKMDVEGAEVEILKGFRPYVESTKHKLKILIEVHPNYYNSDHSFCDQLKWYGKNGFDIKKLISATIEAPPQITRRGYSPVQIYSQGGYSRGVYHKVDVADAIDFIDNREEILFTPPSRKNMLLNLLGLPTKKARTQKIVRGILLERK